MYIASHPNTWKPWRWHFRSVLHLLFSNSRDHLTFSLRLQHSARAWRIWGGLQLFLSLCPRSLGIHKEHLRGSCSHSNLSWAQMGSWRHQSQIHGQSRCHPPSSWPQIHYGIFLSAESALNQKFPFPGRAMTLWRAGTQRQTWGSSWDWRGHLSERWHSSILFCHESRGKDQRTPCWCFMNFGPWKLLGQWQFIQLSAHKLGIWTIS